MAVTEPKLDAHERHYIFELAEKLTGVRQDSGQKLDMIVMNVLALMRTSQCLHFDSYLKRVNEDKQEFYKLLTALAIHTTSWFREKPHFDRVQKFLEERTAAQERKKLQVISAACSTGEEVYSFAMLFEEYKKQDPYFDYEILAFDIDPTCINFAKNGRFSFEDRQEIPIPYRKYIKMVHDLHKSRIEVTQNIRQRCHFKVANLLNYPKGFHESMDLVICRNVLIYLPKNIVNDIVQNLVSILSDKGLMILGHSEAIESNLFSLINVGPTSYMKKRTEPVSSIPAEVQKLKVLVIDDSKTVRKQLSHYIENSDMIPIEAGSVLDASQLIKEKMPDLITLDLHMPDKDGATWLREQRDEGMRIPVVVVSGASAAEGNAVLGALENGAQDYFDKEYLRKDSKEFILCLKAIAETYKNKIKGEFTYKTKKIRKEGFARPELILIGASTGGTEALRCLMKDFPPDSPPVIVVQHISPLFLKPFAERLSKSSRLKLADPTVSHELRAGHLYMAFNNYHLTVQETAGGELRSAIKKTSPVNGHIPSVDVLFESATNIHKKIAAILLTGMGKDGARGISRLGYRGAMTFAQNEESCIVFGMPKEAIKLGNIDFIGDVEAIRNALLTSFLLKS